MPESSRIVFGIEFLVWTEKEAWLKALFLKGTTQSPLEPAPVELFVFFPQILVMEVEDSVNLDGVGLFNSVFPV